MEEGRRGKVTENLAAGQNIRDRSKGTGVSRGLVASKLRMGTNRGMNWQR